MSDNLLAMYIDLTYNVLTFFTYYKYTNYLFNFYKSNRFYTLCYYIMFTFHILMSFIQSKDLMFIMLAFYLITTRLSFKITLKKTIIHVLKFYILYFLPVIALYIILTIIHIFSTDSIFLLDNRFFQNLKGIIISIIMYIIISFKCSIKNTKSSSIYNPYKKYFIVILGIILTVLITFTFVSMNMNDANSNSNYGNVIIINFLLNVFMIILITSFYEKIVDFLQEHALEQITLEKYQMNQTFYDELSIKLKQLSSLKHDFKNHLGVLSGYLYQDNYSAAKKYTDSLLDYSNVTNDIIITNNQTISSILHVKKSECDNLGIIFNCDINFDSIYKITDIDLIILLGNILDNAIQAASCERFNQKVIELEIKQLNSYLTVLCSNTITVPPVEKNGWLITTKKDKQLHGIGLMNVKETCEKYGGDFQYGFDNKTFNIRILIPNY